MEKQRKIANGRWLHLVVACLTIFAVLWLVPTKVDADTKVIMGIQAIYRGSDVQRGSYVNTSDVIVTANYNDGTSENVTGFYLLNPYISQIGTNIITVYYNGLSTTFNVMGIEPLAYYNVYFESNGGTYITPIYSVKSNTTIVLPEAPTRYGYRFRGWYTSSSLITPFSEETPITANTYLYAKWEARAILYGNTISYSVSNGSYSTTISANLSGQKYGQNVDLDVSNIDPIYIKEAVKKIALTDKFIAFDFCMVDYEYSKSRPLPLTVTIPSTFNASKCAVYYTTNRKTIMGKMNGKVVGNTYQFEAYEVGSYILVECQDEVIATTDPASDAYITIEELEEPVTVDGEFALIVQFHNYPESESKLKLNWSSSDTDVADVDDDGVVYAYERGTTTITVKSADGRFKDTYKIRVVADSSIASKIKTNVSSKTLKVGKSFWIETTVSPATADSYVAYSSTNKSVATVTGGGKVYAKKKGSCYITVKTLDGSNLTKKIKITVK